MSNSEYFATVNIIIDDVVKPDGTTFMGQLGGGGAQTAFGMRLFTDNVSIAASVGSDIPGNHLDWLDNSGIDRRSVEIIEDKPTLRAWQLCESDGSVNHIWRVPQDTVIYHRRRLARLIRQHIGSVFGLHIGIHPGFREPLEEFRALANILSVELFAPLAEPMEKTQLKSFLVKCDILSLTERELASLTGLSTIKTNYVLLYDLGAHIVVIRRGANGSTVLDFTQQMIVDIPAVQVDVALDLGAGNAYCGAFLAGWAKHEDTVLAGCYGASAASIIIESIQMPIVSAELEKEALLRAEKLKNNCVVRKP